MSALDILQKQFREKLLPALPTPLRSILEGSSRRQLFKKIDTRILLHDDSLINLDSGDVVQIENASAPISPSALATAAKRIVKSDNAVSSLLLYLPTSEFVSTTLNMPGVSRENIVSALRLQTESLFPSYQEKLTLALSVQSYEQASTNVALWIPESRLSSLFDAFEQQDIFLVGVVPRQLCDQTLSTVLEYDKAGATLIRLSDGAITSWEHISSLDMEQPELSEQWQEAISAVADENLTTLHQATDYLNLSFNNPNPEYCFYPAGALGARKREERNRNLLLLAAAAIVILFVGALPFIGQSFQLRSLLATLDSHRQLSVEARRDQLVVVDFENQWGPINDFPEQRVWEAMFTLQNILLPDRLTSLEVVEGLVKIQGTSTEPQSILQRLEQDPMFTEVAFSRATNNSRYYIDLRLSTVNFEAYMVRYFPDE